MAQVEGIGGVFIDSNDATRLAGWYEKVLGIKMEAHPNGIGYYRVFPIRDAETGILRENPVFAINHAEKELAEKGGGFVINLRVDSLYEFLEMLRSRGVEVEEKILEWERGKHTRIRDLDGNRIELYEEIFPDGARVWNR
jgi:catechol 2,3-dioxygenase-like lactoylglutathione lyase family enzyme